MLYFYLCLKLLGDIFQEFDKQMGDLGDEEKTEKLDERMWGSDDEDEDEEEKSDEKKEEKGQGMDAVNSVSLSDTPSLSP